MAGKPKSPLMIDGHSWDRDKVLNHVCDNLASSSLGIGNILKRGCDGHDLPSYSTFMLWLSEDEELSERYAKAKEAQADYMADETLEIADDGSNDWMERKDKDGENIGWTLNGEHVQRSKLRIDTRKWLASKLKAKKYGDKLQTDITSGGEKIKNDWHIHPVTTK